MTTIDPPFHRALRLRARMSTRMSRIPVPPAAAGRLEEVRQLYVDCWSLLDTNSAFSTVARVARKARKWLHLYTRIARGEVRL